MIDKLRSVLNRNDELEELMSQPDAMRDMKAFTKMAREHSVLTKLVEEAKNYIVIYDRLQEDENILNGNDHELKELAKDEIPYKFRDHAWFIAFAPFKDPQIAVAVIIEHGGHGGTSAAPIAKKVIQAYFKYYPIAPKVKES